MSNQTSQSHYSDNSQLESETGTPSSSSTMARRAVTVGSFAAIYTVVTWVCGMLGFFSPVMIVVGIFIALIINGTVVELLIVKSPHLGTLTCLTFVLAVVMTLGGHPWPYLVGATILGFIADLIVKAGRYSNRLLNSVAYGILSFSPILTVSNLIVNQQEYAQQIARQMSAEYAQAYLEVFSSRNVVIIGICLFVFGIIFGYIGTKLVSKHFAKAGLV